MMPMLSVPSNSSHSAGLTLAGDLDREDRLGEDQQQQAQDGRAEDRQDRAGPDVLLALIRGIEQDGHGGQGEAAEEQPGGPVVGPGAPSEGSTLSMACVFSKPSIFPMIPVRFMRFAPHATSARPG